MTSSEWFRFLLNWTTAGALLFSVFVIVVMKSGLAHIARDPDGTLKKPVPLAGWVMMALSLLMFISFFATAGHALADRLSLDRAAFAAGELFLDTFLGLYVLFCLLLLFDTLVIDFWLLGRRRPAFLGQAEEMNSESMARHIRASVPRGLAIGLMLCLASTWLALRL